jgi:hypothetical protein
MSLVAKPVIDKQFWILQEDNNKVGNIEACAGGYQVKINNQIVAQYKTIKLVERNINVTFEPAIKIEKKKLIPNSVHGFPTAGRVHNPMWDVPQKLPVYTKSKKSRSWYAAGWYTVRKGRHWVAMLNPKLIVLQRYPYKGPFHTQEEADPK